MKSVVTASQMAEMDALCTQKYRIPGLILMENAGRGLADVARTMLKDPIGKNVSIFCGPGNNGGDGYVAARHLTNMGAFVTVHVLAERAKIAGDALVNLTILESTGYSIDFLKRIPQTLQPPPHLIIDAMLGTGVSGPLRGLYAQAVDFLNAQSVPILAVDVPTGVDADNGVINEKAVRAQKTATMAMPKIGLLLPPGRLHAGDLSVVDICMPSEIITLKPSQTWQIEVGDIPPVLPRRAPDAHKNRCGTVAVVAGSSGFTGAATLTSQAVMRSGAGLCYLCSPLSLNPIYEIKLTEVITWPFDDAGTGYLHSGCLSQLLPKLRGQTVVAVGPGLGQHEQTVELVRQLLRELAQPMVLDADGLNACEGHTDLMKNYRGELVLTPHPGELARLTGLSTNDILRDRIAVARDCAAKWGVTLVLKGAPSVIAFTNGHIFINSTGNAGMATAGSGDVLTGIIAGFMAQGVSAQDAAMAGVYVHGLAGDRASRRLGQIGMIAGDILCNVPQTLVDLSRE